MFSVGLKWFSLKWGTWVVCRIFWLKLMIYNILPPKHSAEYAAEQDLSCATVSLSDTAVNCTSHFNTHFSSLRNLPRGHNFNMLPLTHCSTNSTKVPITYPPASTAKIGATVTMLTCTVDRTSLGSFELACCWYNLAWIPLSRNCANLRRKLFSIKCLIHRHILKELLQRHYSYGCINSNRKQRRITDVGDSATVRYIKNLSLLVTKDNYE